MSALRTNTPCCDHDVCLSATESVRKERYVLTCNVCHTEWTITRHVMKAPSGVRIDRLEWEEMTK